MNDQSYLKEIMLDGIKNALPQRTNQRRRATQKEKEKETQIEEEDHAGNSHMSLKRSFAHVKISGNYYLPST